MNKVGYAWQNWVGAADWDIFATLTFGRLELLNGNRDDAAGKIWRSYLNSIDRALYGSARKNTARFNRVAFRHKGANSSNPHVHLLIKSPIATNDFCVLLNAIWASKFPAAAAPSSNEIAPVINKSGAAGYGLHEEFRQDIGSIDERLIYLKADSEHQVRTDAVQRLQAQATKQNLLQAQLALPAHIRSSQLRREQRQRLKMAAMQRQ